MERPDPIYNIPTNCRFFSSLEPGNVMIYGAELDQLMENLTFLESELSEEERRRYRCLYFDKDRRKFIVARGLLRLMLGQCLGRKPSRIEFAYNAHGKPSVAGSPLEFNLSHSGNRVIYGFAVHQAIGVDIEQIREESYDFSIAQQHFAPREADVLKFHPDEAVDNFFIYWTCKEAVLKAMGTGITCGLHEIDLSCMVNELSSSFEFPATGSQVKKWVVTRLNHLHGYTCAVALNSAAKQLVYREITKETLKSFFQ